MSPKKAKKPKSTGKKEKKKNGKKKKEELLPIQPELLAGDETVIDFATPLSLLPIVNVSSTSPSVQAYRVKWDWEVEEFDGNVREIAPAPCVFRCGELNNNLNGHYTPLGREWQFFWFDLCSHIVFGRYHEDLEPEEYRMLAGKWTGVGGNTTAFMNNKGLDKLRNYVEDERADLKDAAIYTLVCGGATITGTPIKNGNNRMMLKVDHFDGLKPPPAVETIDPYSDPRIYFATIVSDKKIQGGFKVFPFPQFKGKDVPVPLIAGKDIFYPMDNLVKIEIPQKPRPYFP